MTSMQDIAKLAGVSVSTVSKAVNNKTDISEKTRKKILEIAQAYNYKPKPKKSKRTENIGVIFIKETQPMPLNPFFSRVLEGIEGELAINSYNLVLNLLSNDKENRLPKMVAEKKVDGVLLVGVIKKKLIDKINATGIPLYLVDPRMQFNDLPQIMADNEHGAFLATQHLINNNHQKIAFISGELDRISFKQRFLGYKKALRYNDIEFRQDYIKVGGLEEGYVHTRALLNLEEPPTAIFSVNDINAIYGFKAATDKGLKIPDDLSFVGFDDIDMARISSPPLTTIRVYKEEMGSIAVRNILKIIDNRSAANSNTVMPIKLIERNSVA